MRLDSDILFDVIPKFLRDGWQVVSYILSFQSYVNPGLTNSPECPCYRRSSERHCLGRF